MEYLNVNVSDVTMTLHPKKKSQSVVNVKWNYVNKLLVMVNNAYAIGVKLAIYRKIALLNVINAK